MRLEAWRNAQDHGNYIAARLTGVLEPYRGNPWFWSDQYELHLQITGHAEAAARHVTRTISDKARILFHLDGGGRLVAASGLGPLGEIARDMRLAEMLVVQGASPDAAALADPAIKLKQLLRG